MSQADTLWLISSHDPVIISMVVVGFVLSFALAFGVGANDVANFFGTVVGTKTLKLWQAFVIASIFEMSGSILLGMKVSDSVRKSIVQKDLFREYYDYSEKCLYPNKTNPSDLQDVESGKRTCGDLVTLEFALGTLVGSAVWLAGANIARLPVSTTHSIVGSTIGAGLVGLQGEANTINWGKVGHIVASWVVSPAISGFVSGALYYLLYIFVLKKNNSFEICMKVVPFIYFVTIFVNVVAVLNTSHTILEKKLGKQFYVWQFVLVAFGCGLIIFILTFLVINPYTRRRINRAVNQRKIAPSSSSPDKSKVDYQPQENQETVIAIDGSNLNPTTTNQDNQCVVVTSISTCPGNTSTPVKASITTSQDGLEIDNDCIRGCSDVRTNAMFYILQIVMSCFGAFVHGGNDISNSVSPLLTIWEVFRKGSKIVNSQSGVDLNANSSSPEYWILVYGGLGMVVGLVCLGKRVIDTVGKNITKISPISGFTIELGSALTVLVGTMSKIPISTTHCQIGSVIAVGILRNGRHKVNLKIIRNIVISWLVTLPVSGLLSAATIAIARVSVSAIVKPGQ